MKRRDLIKRAGAIAGAGAGAAAAAIPAKSSAQSIEWKMVTTWPKNFPGLGTGAELLAENIGRMSNGRLTVKVFGAGEIVPAFESFDAVSQGTAEMGHAASYYWRSKSEAAQFFTAVPFGFTADEISAWVYHGGGQQLWDEIYSDFNLKPFPALNTGVQMGGWFNREINSVADVKGLTMRIPGLAGDVLTELGGTPKALPGGEIFTALQSGLIDATEWVGPYNDLAFGIYKAAKYYYYPGWHEPGSLLEAFVNLDAYNALDSDLQKVVEVACQSAYQDTYSELYARNGAALATLVNEHGVELRRFPDDMLRDLRKISDQVLADLSNSDPASKKVYDSYIKFKKQVDGKAGWTNVSELAYLQARAL